MIRHVALCALISAATAAGTAAAAEVSPGHPTLKVQGFGTAGVVHSSEKNADYTQSFLQPNGAGYTRDWAHGVDSKLGVQADVHLTERLSAVLQLVVQYRPDGSYEPRVEWANVRYLITPDLDVRVGRTVTTPFMLSDTRLVGYANPWIRAPREVYGLIPMTNKDGIDATYRMHFGDITHSVHASYGQTAQSLPGGRLETRDAVSVSHTVERGALTARVSYVSARLDLRVNQLETLLNGYAQLGNALRPFPAFQSQAAAAAAVVDRYSFNRDPISVLGVGASYTRDPWLLIAEWAKFNGHSVLSDSTGWYVTAGYRLGAFTPYATVARVQAEQSVDPGVSPAGMPAPLASSAAALNAALNATLTSSRFAQKSAAVGVRWDFARKAAFKLQYDRIDFDEGASGRLVNVQPQFRPGGHVHLFSAAIDFVF